MFQFYCGTRLRSTSSTGDQASHQGNCSPKLQLTRSCVQSCITISEHFSLTFPIPCRLSALVRLQTIPAVNSPNFPHFPQEWVLRHSSNKTLHSTFIYTQTFNSMKGILCSKSNFGTKVVRVLEMAVFYFMRFSFVQSINKRYRSIMVCN